jgi:hypothetical protein
LQADGSQPPPVLVPPPAPEPPGGGGLKLEHDVTEYVPCAQATGNRSGVHVATGVPPISAQLPDPA